MLSRYDVGDHVGFLLEPVAGSAPDKFEQLVTFSDVRDLDPGHEAFELMRSNDIERTNDRSSISAAIGRRRASSPSTSGGVR